MTYTNSRHQWSFAINHFTSPHTNMSLKSDGCLRVRLHPFRHQVSGTTQMLEFDSATICKPLLPKEYHFYKYLPKELKEFTARYKGSIDIVSEGNDEETMTFFGIVPPSKIDSLNLDLSNAMMNTSDDEDMQSDDGETCVDFISDTPPNDLKLESSGAIDMDEDSMDCYHSPEKTLAAKEKLQKRLTSLLGGESGTKQRFILLENLVAYYRCPSILDLKMGTRTYGDDDSENKKADKLRKAENSTTKSYGVRLCGMQKYNAATGKYETYSKDDGLKFTDLQFEQCIKEFLHDGNRYRIELIQSIINRLKRFHKCVSAQHTFRFYSSSLLILYDGDENHNKSVDLRCIDFAHTTYKDSPLGVTKSHSGPDLGYLFGIDSLIMLFQKMMT